MLIFGMGARICWVAAAVLMGVVCAPIGTAEAEISSCRRGYASVSVDGRVAWCASSQRQTVVSEVIESERAGAVAFAVHTSGVGTELVVVLIGGENDLLTMKWDVPEPRGRQRDPTVMWLGKQRVGFGYSPVRPDVIATWKIRER